MQDTQQDAVARARAKAPHSFAAAAAFGLAAAALDALAIIDSGRIREGRNALARALGQPEVQ